MGQDFSWDKSAVEYIKLYSEVLGLDYREQLAPKVPELAVVSGATQVENPAAATDTDPYRPSSASSSTLNGPASK
jgi:starch synthase